MFKLGTRLTTVLLAMLLALPTISCQQKENMKENEKTLDVQVDAGNTKVKVEGSKNPDEKGRHLDVDVERHPGNEHEFGDGGK